MNNGIGTRNETTMHSFLKSYIDPNALHHEVHVAPYIADIVNECGIFEIQSRQFFRIRAKLEYLLKIAPVTLVYPIAAHKTLYWIDPETGNCSSGRKSNKRCTVCEIWRELPDIADLLKNNMFSIRIVFAEMEEYRVLDGLGVQKKRRATHVDRRILSIQQEILLRTPRALAVLIPQPLPDEYTSLDFAKIGRIPRHAAQRALAVLYQYGIVSRVSHDRSGFRYRMTYTELGNESDYIKE